MWKLNNLINLKNSNDMALALTALRQDPKPVMISFDSTIDGLTHILNADTFPQCDVPTFQSAKNIKVWAKIP